MVNLLIICKLLFRAIKVFFVIYQLMHNWIVFVFQIVFVFVMLDMYITFLVSSMYSYFHFLPFFLSFFFFISFFVSFYTFFSVGLYFLCLRYGCSFEKFQDAHCGMMRSDFCWSVSPPHPFLFGLHFGLWGLELFSAFSVSSILDRFCSML
jgi:hypothetical protein